MKPEIKREVAINMLKDIFFASFHLIPLIKAQYPVEVYYVDLINRYISRIPVADQVDINVATCTYIYKFIDKKRIIVETFLGADYPPIKNTMHNKCLLFYHEIRCLYENRNIVDNIPIIKNAISDYNYWVMTLASWVGLCRSLVPDEMVSILLTVNCIREEFAKIGFSWMETNDINYVPLPYALFKR